MVGSIARVIVGSQLHGLSNEYSDVDYVDVIMSPPHELFSPFYTQRAKVQKDNVSQFELRHLLYLCTKGNPTALEVLWSNLYEDCESIWYRILSHRRKLLSSRAVYEAHKGYSLSQKKLKEGDNETRRVKARVAELRILVQGVDLLCKGTFSPQPTNYASVLRAYKNGDYSCEKAIDQYIDIEQLRLEQAYNEASLPPQLDREWFDQWVYDLYVEIT